MSRKLFIVARGNEAAYGQLQRTVGREPGVQIIFDRRRPKPKRAGKLRRVASGVTGMLGGSRTEASREASGRRHRLDVAEDLKTQGWAVVRLDDHNDV